MIQDHSSNHGRLYEPELRQATALRSRASRDQEAAWRTRAAKVTVIYSIIPNSTTADIITEVAPAADEPSVQSGLDKFYKTNLEQILKDKGIETVIVVGTSTEGLIIYTGGAAATRGFNVVVPIDGMASAEAYAEQYGAWHMTHAPIVSSKVTLTRTGMIKF